MSGQQAELVFAKLARELEGLARMAAKIDSVVGSLARNARFPVAPADLQQIDLLRQSLFASADFVWKLAQQCDDLWCLDPILATRKMPLRELAARLCADPTETPDAKSDSSAVKRHGDVSWF